MAKLGRADVIAEVSLLSSHLVMPRKRHMDAAVHIMACMCKKCNSRLVHDPSYPCIDHSVFCKCDWIEFY